MGKKGQGRGEQREEKKEKEKQRRDKRGGEGDEMGRTNKAKSRRWGGHGLEAVWSLCLDAIVSRDFSLCVPSAFIPPPHPSLLFSCSAIRSFVQTVPQSTLTFTNTCKASHGMVQKIVGRLDGCREKKYKKLFILGWDKRCLLEPMHSQNIVSCHVAFCLCDRQRQD